MCAYNVSGTKKKILDFDFISQVEIKSSVTYKQIKSSDIIFEAGRDKKAFSVSKSILLNKWTQFGSR